MRNARFVFIAVFLFLVCWVPMATAQDNPFVEFRVSGTFLNTNVKATLSGWFIVNEENGQVIRADFFHGSTELATLTSSVELVPDAFSLYLTNTAGDSLNLILVAPQNDGSLAGYAGGPICTASYVPEPCGGSESSFFKGRVSYDTEDVVSVGSVTEAGPVPLVSISINPGTARPVLINPRSHGLTPIAILSTRQFDAVTDIDTQSLTFGATGDEQSLGFCDKEGEDINGHRLPDLICHFKTRSTQFIPSDSVGILVGNTTQGSPFIGLEKVAVKPIGKWPTLPCRQQVELSAFESK